MVFLTDYTELDFNKDVNKWRIELRTPKFDRIVHTPIFQQNNTSCTNVTEINKGKQLNVQNSNISVLCANYFNVAQKHTKSQWMKCLC